MSYQAQTRNGFFPSVGAAPLAVPYSSYWQDTSQADALTGIWDNPSGTGFALKSAAWTKPYNGGQPSTLVLLRQFVFPAFGALGFINPFTQGGPNFGWGLYSGLAGSTLAVPIARSLVQSILTAGLVTPPAAKAYIQNILYAYIVNAAAVAQAHVYSPSGRTISITTLTAETYNAGLYTNQAYVPAATDLLVVELGFRLFNFYGSTLTFTAEAEFGDSAAQYLVQGMTTQENPGTTFSYFTTGAAPPTPPTITAPRAQGGGSGKNALPVCQPAVALPQPKCFLDEGPRGEPEDLIMIQSSFSHRWPRW